MSKSGEPRELDLTAVLCLAPSVLYVVGMFVYPFLHGIYLSLRPAKQPGLSLANYVAFFSDEWQYGTIWITFSLAIPTTIIVVSTALFLAYGMRRGIRMERTITTILVLPVSLGVILLSIGIQGFYGSRGWFNQFLVGAGLLCEPLQLTNNKTGVMLSLFMQQFPFCFLMLLGYISGIDPTLEKSARTLGATPMDRIPPRDAAADGAGHRHRVRAGVRDEFRGVPVGDPARAAGRLNPHDRDCGLSSGLRALRHVLRVGDRGDHGTVPARRPLADRAVAAANDHGAHHGRGEKITMRGKLWSLALYLFVLGFILNLLGIVTHVAVSAFAKRWFGTPLPPQFTTDWFVYAWNNFDLDRVLMVTVMVALSVVALALLLAYPAAYILARRNFRGKALLLLLYFLPLVIPQMTYGISLATTLYGWPIGGTIVAVILANLVPMVPLAVFVLMPFFEQISLNLEWGAQTLGASRFQIFRRILLPLTVPGLLTAGVLILVNTVSNFELTFLVSGSGSQTLVVALFYNVFAGGVRPVYSVDAMALMYMSTVLVILLVALHFVRPTQMVFRLDQPAR